MLKFINLKNLTAKTLIGILLVGGLITPSGTKKAVASDGVQGLELRYAESAFQCGSDPIQADIKVEVRNKSNQELLTTLSKGDVYTSDDFDSISDFDLVYKIYNFSHCGDSFPDGTTRSVRGSKLLGANEAVPDLAGFSGQSSVGQIHSNLDSYEELLLVELGTSDTDSASYDLQDVVLVVDHNPQSLVDAQNNDNDVIIPTLWGIDEDDGQLFSMGDYTDSSTMTDYGQLKWNNNGTTEIIDTDMEAMTLDENGDMYIALDRKLSGTGRGATLLKFNIANASTTEDNVVQVIGEIGINFDNSDDNVSGLSIDPNTGNLVALLKNDGWSQTDKLYVISKVDGSVLSEIGNITGLGESSTNAEDIEHAPDGTLYVTDNADDHTYQVNGLTGAIIEVIDDSQENGLDSSSVKFEALGWDFANNRLIGFDDNDESLARLTLENGNNQKYYDTSGIRLTDVEGVDFVPTIDGLPTEFLDYDDDGVEDPIEQPPTNSDSDSDGDGIKDSVEGTADDDDDGTPNYQDTDSDNNGIDDEYEVGSDSDAPVDSDNDNIPDYLDEDDDNNGIKDKAEIMNGGVNKRSQNPNKGYDLNGDGVDDIYPHDLDEDGKPDFLDKDDDGDGIPDKKEISRDNDTRTLRKTNYDINGDNTPDVLAYDTDGDDIPDYLEEDSDNDGINDIDEGDADADGDGFPNFQDLDSDNNSILDANEGLNSSLDDLDEDGTRDFLDDDDDNDGIIDLIEIGRNPDYPTNSDKDTSDGYDYQDTDSDNDGMLDAHEGYNNSLPDEAAITIRVLDKANANSIIRTNYKLQDMDPDDTKKNGKKDKHICVDADESTGNKCIIQIQLDEDANDGTVNINNTIRGLDYKVYNYAD